VYLKNHLTGPTDVFGAFPKLPGLMGHSKVILTGAEMGSFRGDGQLRRHKMVDYGIRAEDHARVHGQEFLRGYRRRDRGVRLYA
jgi:hypothetical protein